MEGSQRYYDHYRCQSTVKISAFRTHYQFIHHGEWKRLHQYCGEYIHHFNRKRHYKSENQIPCSLCMDEMDPVMSISVMDCQSPSPWHTCHMSPSHSGKESKTESDNFGNIRISKVAQSSICSFECIRNTNLRHRQVILIPGIWRLFPNGSYWIIISISSKIAWETYHESVSERLSIAQNSINCTLHWCCGHHM